MSLGSFPASFCGWSCLLPSGLSFETICAQKSGSVSLDSSPVLSCPLAFLQYVPRGSLVMQLLACTAPVVPPSSSLGVSSDHSLALHLLFLFLGLGSGEFLASAGVLLGASPGLQASSITNFAGRLLPHSYFWLRSSLPSNP